MTDFRGVITAWRKADPKHIHPTREHESEVAYWNSGVPQAQTVFDLVGEGAAVLDFGCGDGRIAIPMAQLGLVVLACDAAPEMIERLRHQAEVKGVEGIRAFVWDGVSSPDVPLVHAVNARAVFIHHSHTDVMRMVRNLAKCLQPGGYLIADWPLGEHHQRIDWIDVTTWDRGKRQAVADAAGLELVTEGIPGERPSVWRKQ